MNGDCLHGCDGVAAALGVFGFNFVNLGTVAFRCGLWPFGCGLWPLRCGHGPIGVFGWLLANRYLGLGLCILLLSPWSYESLYFSVI